MAPGGESDQRARPERRVGGAIRIGRLFGIGVFVHWSFWLLIAFVIYLHAAQGATVWQIAEGVALIFAIFACVVLHECGHALAARRYGIGTRSITLMVIGGIASLERMPRKPSQELVVAVAGPMVNVVIAGVLFVGLLLVRGSVRQDEALLQAGGAYFDKLMWINVILVVFNMIPAMPMDGGRVLRALLAMKFGYERATRASARLAQTLAIGFAIVGFFWWQPLLIVIGVFVFFGAAAEAQMAIARSAIESLKVERAMMPDYLVIEPGARISDAIEALVTSRQSAFPVMEGNEVVAMLTREHIHKAAEAGEQDVPVMDYADRDFLRLSPDEPLVDAVDRLQQAEKSAALVEDDSGPVGILTREGVGELISLRASFKGRRG